MKRISKHTSNSIISDFLSSSNGLVQRGGGLDAPVSPVLLQSMLPKDDGDGFATAAFIESFQAMSNSARNKRVRSDETPIT